MQLKMNEETYGYIREKGQEVTLDVKAAQMCCGSIAEPFLAFKAPANPASFTRLTFKDLVVYVGRGIEFKEDVVEIVLKRTLFLKEILFPTVKVNL